MSNFEEVIEVSKELFIAIIIKNESMPIIVPTITLNQINPDLFLKTEK